MEIDKQFVNQALSEFRSEIGAVVTELAVIVKAGFTDLSKRIDETNARLDQTNARLDETNARLDQTNARLDQTNARLDETNARLDQTNVRLDASINMVRDFRKDVSNRFDEVGGYLRSINGNILQHEERIKSLEQRVDKLERTG